jgi:glycosyltransferase involved in cell wall biosynthesis
MNVDVIIPIYNQSKYLPQALDSVLKQGVLRKNIYVIDDCSSDRPDLIASKYNIAYLKTDQNSGPAVARNLGIKSSSSEFIAFLDADDMMLPGRVLSSLNSLLQSNAGMVCGNYCFWVNRSSVTAPFYKSSVQISYQNMIMNNFVACGSVTIRRSVLEDVGGFNPEYLVAEDYDLWLRVVEKYKINYIHNPLYLYHRDTINKNSLTSNPKNLDLLLKNVEKIKAASISRMK